MNRVRKTAKWSQLYKTGPSIPPKNKASFLNNPDDEEDDDAPENKDGMLSSGTYRHADRELDDMNQDVQGNRSNLI